MGSGKRAMVALAALVALVLGAGPGRAEPSKAKAPAQSAKAAEAKITARLVRTGKDERYISPRHDSRIAAGAVRLHVKSSLETLKKVVQDFPHYATLGHEFDKVKVLRRSKKTGRTDVYLRFPIMHGAAHMWVVFRFDKMKCPTADYCELRARSLRGNVDRFDILYKLQRLGKNSVRFDLQMLVHPRLPFPGFIVSKESSRQAAKAARRLRNRAQQLELELASKRAAAKSRKVRKKKRTARRRGRKKKSR